MKHSLLSTRRVISSIITGNFFVTRNKQPMTIGTNRMCILYYYRRQYWVNTMCFPRQLPTTARKLFTFVAFFDVCDTSCPIGKVPFSFLLLSMPQLSIGSMCQSGRMKGCERCFKVEDQAIPVLGAYRISVLQFCDRLRRGYKLSFMSAIWQRKIPPSIKWAPFGEKARYWKYSAPFGDNRAR